jgi:cobalamin biosynthesis Mg chelatase CobN
MEPIEMNELDQAQKIERVILDSQSVAVVKAVSDQISLELGDLVQVTQKLVSNFLIRKRSQPLSKQEMSEFLSENYDLVKALKHATNEVIKARQNGDQIEINDLLKFIQTPSVKSETSATTKRGRKKKSIAGPATADLKAASLGPNSDQQSNYLRENEVPNTDSISTAKRSSSKPESP